MTERAELCAVQDILVVDDEGVALIHDRLIWLSPLAVLLVGRLSSGVASVEDLATEAVRRFGPPPDGEPPEDAVVAALRRLAEERLVTLI